MARTPDRKNADVLRILFVSDVSPSLGGVHGLRVRSVARGLARLGHETAILAPAVPDVDWPLGDDLAERIAARPAGEPALLTPLCEERGGPVPSRRSLATKLRTAHAFLVHGGVRPGWIRTGRRWGRPILDAFPADAVVAVFGDTSTLMIGRSVARAAGAPLVVDAKDNWQNYVSPLVRTLMQRRLAEVAALTSNAHLHLDAAAPHFSCPGTVVYSAGADTMRAAPSSTADREHFTVMMVGSTYRHDMLSTFLAVLARWAGTKLAAERARIRYAYAGRSRAMVEACLARVGLPFPTIVRDNLSHEDLAALCQSAFVNAYIWLPLTFHYKLVELISTRRPVLAFPGEHEESIAIAREMGGELLMCQDEAALAEGFETLWQRWTSGNVRAVDLRPNPFTWDAAARSFAQLLSRCVAERAGA